MRLSTGLAPAAAPLGLGRLPVVALQGAGLFSRTRIALASLGNPLDQALVVEPQPGADSSKRNDVRFDRASHRLAETLSRSAAPATSGISLSVSTVGDAEAIR